MPRPPFDVSALVPSTRDFLQTLATRRKRLALLPRVAAEATLSELVDAGAVAIAVDEAGPTMRAIANGCDVPVLCLAPIACEDDALAARAYGADAVLVAPMLDDALVKRARATRLAVVPLCVDLASAKSAIDLGARALVARGSLDVVLAIAAAVPHTTRVVAFIESSNADTVRALVSKVDAAIVDPQPDFAALRAEVDPD